MRNATIATCSLLLAACSGGSSPSDGSADVATDIVSADARGDGATVADAVEESTPDAGPPVLCDTTVMLDTTLMLDPGAGPNVNVAAAFDGAQLWLAYNRPAANGSGQFDVFVERMHCDGTVSVQPFAVNTVPMVNNVDPDVAVGDGHVYLAWAGDTGMFPNNLDIYFRTYQVDGSPIMPAEQTLETTHNGAPAPGSAWMSVLSPLPGERFVIAGSRAIDDPTPHFQVFVQQLDVHGTLIGSALEPDLEANDQQNPTVAAATNGAVYVAWDNIDSDGGYHAVGTHYAPDASTAPAPVDLTTLASSGGPSYAIEPGNDAHVFVAFVQPDSLGKGQIVLADGSFAAGSGTPVTFGIDGIDDETPIVAAAPGGGAVAWYEQRGSAIWDLHAMRFTFDGSTFQLGGNTVVPVTRLAPYYQPALTHVQGNTYFVAWSEGTSPMLTLKGRFVNLP